MTMLKVETPSATLDVAIYRRENTDLAHMSDKDLKRHFAEHGWSERRTFALTSSTRDAFSMRWLRGLGLEVGAGDNPTPVFGQAVLEQGEVDADFAFGGSGSTHQFSIDGETPEQLRGRYDFVIASHVLEHCDSFIRGLSNLAALINENGVIYMTLPDKRYLHDNAWLPDFDLEHHLIEWKDPLAFDQLHDEQFCDSVVGDFRTGQAASTISDEYAEAVAKRRIPQHHRFMTHKHNYRFGDWVTLVMQVLPLIDPRLVLEDCAFGSQRKDCHFIIIKR